MLTNQRIKIKKESLKKDWKTEAEKADWKVLRDAMDYAISNVSDNLEELRDKILCPAGISGEYPTKDTVESICAWDWTASFWTGMIWLAYDVTGEEKYREAGLHQAELFRIALEKSPDLHHHDIGFLYSLSCVAAYRLTGDEQAKETAVLAARRLLMQYMEKCGVFQQNALPDDRDYSGRGNAIIDCCMNLPLLYWASTATGETEFYEKAYNHIRNASIKLVKENGATHQNMVFDVDTGELLKVFTSQGDGDEDGCWSRGQA